MENQLFPVVTVETKHKVNAPSLFPSAGTSHSNSKAYIDEKIPDWLENKSFTSKTAEKVVEFQKELQNLQGVSSEDESEEDQNTSSNLYVPASRLKNNATQVVDNKKTEEEKYSLIHSESSDSEIRETRQYKDRNIKKKKRRYPSSDSDNDNRRKKKSSKHKHKKKHKKHKHSHRDSLSTKPDIPGLFTDQKHIFLDDVAEVAPEHPFKLDRQPDKYSWTYGSLYSGNIASYRQVCQQCLGTSGRNSIRVNNTDKKKPNIVPDRYYLKENRKLIKQVPLEVILMTDKDGSRTEANPIKEEYIPVGSHMTGDKVFKDRLDVRERILDDSTTLYVQGVGSKSTGTPEEMDIELDQTRMKVGEFNRKLRETPGDVKLWLDFVKFQDSISVENLTNLSKVEDSNKSEKRLTQRGLLDKKISILDKALEQNQGDIDLLLAKVELNAEILDSVKVNKELEQLLFVHQANTKLWKYYLMFNQSRLAVFTVSKVSKLYHKCLRTLLGIHTGRIQTHTVPADLEKEFLEIFIQYCYFLKQAGHKEPAIASYQAMLEFNLFSPTSLQNVTMETKMSAFEEFWDGSQAKLGTPGACGWMNQPENTNSKPVEAAVLDELEEAIIEKQLPKHATWLEIELLRDHNHWLPWQPDLTEGQTEEDCEDPERLVVFDDIKPVMFHVSKKFHFQLIVAFLEFLGYRSYKQNCSDFEKFVETFQDKSKELKICQSSNEDDRTGNDIIRVFATELLKQVLPCCSETERSDLTLRLVEIQLSHFGPAESLSKSDKKEMRKTMKTVLKEEQNRNDLRVWCAYIDLERQIGKPGEAKAIAETALSMHSGKCIEGASNDVNGLISLYVLYCELLLNINQEKPKSLLPKKVPVSAEVKKTVMAVLGYLLEARKFNPKEVEANKLTGAMVLKLSSTFAKQINATCDTLCKNELNNKLLLQKYLNLIWCSALFSYCRSGLESSLNILLQQSEKVTHLAPIDHDSDTEQCLHSGKLKLIVYHMSVTSSPLSILREHLDVMLQKYPNDITCLSLFVDIERKSRVSGRLTRYFDKWCRKVESPWPALIGVRQQCDFLRELQTAVTVDGSTSSSGLVHRARSWLEHSLFLPRLVHSPLLWRLYLQLESIVEGGCRLKGVFYRAIQQCPWNKALYLDGVGLLGSEQLQEIVDLMTEKELRVQIPVEELDILLKP